MFILKPKEDIEWFVVFEHSEEKFWYQKLLKTGFHHVYIMRKSTGGHFWLILDSSISNLNIDARSAKTFETAREYAGDYATVLKCPVSIDTLVHTWQPGIITCVDVVKRCLGIRALRVQTPFQLFQYLERNCHGISV